TVSGGTIPYNFIWNNGSISQNISNLISGDYKVIVSDNHFCNDSLSVNISQPQKITLSETHNNISCFGGGDGAVNLTVSGGTNLYNFIWNTGSISQNINNLIS